MPSPFPGMDPWLEHPAMFPDVHDSMIFLLREAINEVLPEPYIANSRNRVFVEKGKKNQYREPDVTVTSPKNKSPKGGPAIRERVMLTRMSPVLDPYEYGEHEENYLDIFTSNEERLVTSVEILSPINKRKGSAGRQSYLKKQAKMLKAGINLVEIDLLRTGEHTTVISLDSLDLMIPRGNYHVCVTGSSVYPQQYVAAFLVQNRLPVIEVPLDRGVEPIAIELQPLFDRAYDSGNYKRRDVYSKPAYPHLTAEQAVWAEGILKKKGLLK